MKEENSHKLGDSYYMPKWTPNILPSILKIAVAYSKMESLLTNFEKI